MTSVDNGNEWQLTMEKSHNIIPDGKDIVISFKPDIKITDFALRQGNKDENCIYVGDSIYTKNTFGDLSGDSIIQANQTYPTFSIYKITDEGRKLVYSKTDRGNTSSSFWNSSNMYEGNIPPGAGKYIAQLSYDAGPFGGKTIKEINFEMRTKSGGEEMTSTITMDGTYKMSYASLDIYSWDDKSDSWNKVNVKNLKQAGEDGVIRNISTDNIMLGDTGINVAVVEFDGRKQGYQLPGEYVGFVAIPFTTLNDLEVININSYDLTAMTVGITDQYGNRKSGNIYFPVASNGGKLAKSHTVCDIELGIGPALTAKVYIPKGEYDYAYSKFNDSESNYFLSSERFNTQEKTSVLLDGQNVKTLNLDIDKKYRNSKTLIGLKNAEGVVAFSNSIGNTIKMTPGQYRLSMEAVSINHEYKYLVSKDNVLNMTEDETWSVRATFTPEIVLKQKTVAHEQMLLADMYFRDGQGNCLTGLKKLNEDNYDTAFPDIKVGAERIGEQSFSADSYEGFYVNTEYYYGEGPHYVYIVYDIGNGIRTTGKYSFIVGLDYEPRIEPVDTSLFSIKNISDKVVEFTAGNNTSGYLPVTVCLNTSSRNREIVFIQLRAGKEIRKVAVSSIFANKNNNNLRAYFNVKPGDKIIAKAK